MWSRLDARGLVQYCLVVVAFSRLWSLWIIHKSTPYQALSVIASRQEVHVNGPQQPGILPKNLDVDIMLGLICSDHEIEL